MPHEIVAHAVPACRPWPRAAARRSTDVGLARIEHVVVIYAENRSFDHLYGLFPGAEGIAQATAEQKTQLDHDGKPLPHLPPTCDHGKPSARFATEKLPNGPFRIDAPPINGRMDEVLPSPLAPLLPEHASRSTAAGTTCSSPWRTSAAGRWATSTARR